jgi:hypothetical protein
MQPASIEDSTPPSDSPHPSVAATFMSPVTALHASYQPTLLREGGQREFFNPIGQGSAHADAARLILLPEKEEMPY